MLSSWSVVMEESAMSVGSIFSQMILMHAIFVGRQSITFLKWISVLSSMTSSKLSVRRLSNKSKTTKTTMLGRRFQNNIVALQFLIRLIAQCQLSKLKAGRDPHLLTWGATESFTTREVILRCSSRAWCPKTVGSSPYSSSKIRSITLFSQPISSSNQKCRITST
jgi:hypothetical protein